MREFKTAYFGHLIGILNTYIPCTIEEIQAKHRNGLTPDKRKITAFALKSVHDKAIPYRLIGELQGFRDHSSIIHQVEVVEEWAIGDPAMYAIAEKVAAEYREFVDNLNGGSAKLEIEMIDMQVKRLRRKSEILLEQAEKLESRLNTYIGKL